MQEQKKIMPAVLEVLFAGYVQALKEIEIPYEYYYAEDGNWYAFTDFLTPCHADGENLSECENDLIEVLRVMSESYFEDLRKGLSVSAQEKLCLLKVLYSSDAELKRCLRGKVLENT